MSSESQRGPGRNWVLWVGWIISVLPVLILLMSAVMKFQQPDDVVKGFDHLGWDIRLAVALGVIEIGCALVYLISWTAILGAVLLTGYLGGAIATHLRVGDPFVPN